MIMSAWVNGKLDLKCSLDVLKRAISNLMPQWAEHIQVDPSGKLSMYRYNGERRNDITVQLVIPGPGNPNAGSIPDRMAENDWGFSQRKDGTWNIYAADYHKAEAFDLANKAKAEVARMRMLAMAKLRGYQTTKNSVSQGKAEMEFLVPQEVAQQFAELA
jgi:hypothetical protein